RPESRSWVRMGSGSTYGSRFRPPYEDQPGDETPIGTDLSRPGIRGPVQRFKATNIPKRGHDFSNNDTRELWTEDTSKFTGKYLIANYGTKKDRVLRWKHGLTYWHPQGLTPNPDNVWWATKP